MRFFNIFLLALLFTIGSNNALADGGSTEKSQHLRSDSHAPISIMGDHMHKKDEFMVSYRYMFMGMDGYQSGSSSSNYTEARKNPLGGNYMTVPEEMDMKMHMIGAMYAIDDDITLMIMGSYIDNEMKVKKHMNKATKTLESSGWGDTKFTALKNLHHDRNFKLHGSLGLSLPTGSITKKDVMFKTTEETLGYNMQLGSGTYDLLPAFTAVLLEEEYSFGAQISSVFRIGQNSKDYALGDIYKANIWFAVPFNEDKTSISIASQYKYQDKIQHVLTRHEQGATHSAQGFARISGRVGVAIATSGPGATNLVTGIADAQIDSTPMVCITGQVGSHLLGSDAFQETDIIGISTPITKWNYQITKASEIPEIFAKAFYIAKSGRPGPVLIDITKDAQFEEFNFSYKRINRIRSYKPTPIINMGKIQQAADLINMAKKPLIVWGQGVILANAEKEFTDLIEKSGIPAAWTILGASAIPTDHSLNVGMLGMHGNYAPNVLTNECDVLIAIGMRFDDRVTGDVNRYAKQAKIIHFEIDPAEVNKNIEIHIPVLGDAKETLSKIIPLIDKKSHKNWLDEFKKLYQIEYDKVIDGELNPSKKGLTMGEVIKEINFQTKGNAAIVSDVGQHQMVACRYANFNKSKSNITSGGLGTMGFALPAAIGAKMASPEREVVAVIGDGGYQMTIQELGTVFQTKAAVKIVVLNNDFLGMVRQWQQLFFDKRYAETEMVNPDFVAIAKGYYIKANRVENRKDLNDAIKEMILSKEPYFLEVCVEKEDNVFPMIPSGESVSNIRLE